MKRFYKETAVDLGDGGHRILLDGKPMRTPAKAVLGVPTRALAEAIAAEWGEVPDKAEINASHLPLTRLAATPETEARCRPSSPFARSVAATSCSR